MNPTTISFLSITDLARAYRDRSLSPIEVTRVLLDRIQMIDPALKAFIRLTPDRALREAGNAERSFRRGNDPGPLCGIPYAVKDLFDVQGLPTTAGTRLLENHRAVRDSRAVQRLTRAGLVLLGKTRTVQFAYGGVGINHDQGTPHNPWQREPYVPGGSSSGSAVAVASGLAPLALGTDTAGSVRIPAALCGLVGLKTTFGSISRNGVYPLSDHLDSIGPLTRTVEDAALAAQALLGHDLEDEATRMARFPRRPFAGLKQSIAGLRLALGETVFFDEADPEVAAAVRQAAVVFQDLGAEVRSLEVPEAWDILANRNAARFTAAEACVVNQVFLDHHLAELDPVVAQRMLGGRTLLATEFIAVWRQWRTLRKRLRERLAHSAALIVPTTPLPAAPLEAVDFSEDAYRRFNAAYLRNTFVISALNGCAVSLPCGFTSRGLPIGLMICSRPFQEAVVLRLAHAYEQATDWHRRRPDLSWVA